jgi:tetratricopeptide (TPR) repeat protein
MRALRLAMIALVALLAAGCPNKERNASIEAMNKGVGLMTTGSSNTAVNQFKEAVRLYPANHQAWYALGQIYFKESKWKESAEAFGEALKHRKDDAMYQMYRGRALFMDGSIDPAIQHLEEAVKINNDVYKAHEYLGDAYLASDRPKDAAQEWTMSAQLNPTEGAPFSSLGKLYLEWDQPELALKVLQQAELNVKGEKPLSEVYTLLGLAYDAQGNVDKAIEAYSKAIEIRGDNLDAKFQRGLDYAAKKDKAKAKADLEEYGKGGDNSFNKTQANKALVLLMAEP